MSPRPGPLLVAALCASLAACEGSAPAPPKVLGDVAVGFAGAVHGERAPTPVWIDLENPTDAALPLRVVARGAEASQAEHTLELPAGAHHRIALAVRTRDRLLVEVFQGQRRLDLRELKGLPVLDVERHILVVDGRPADRRRVRGGGRSTDPTVRMTTVDPRNAPTEAIAYAPFGAVLVRGVAPSSWGRARHAALLEYVAAGGTLLIPGATARSPDDQALVASLPGTWRRTPVLGLRARSLRLGRGEVVAFDDELLAAAAASSPKAAQLRQDLGDLVEGRRGRARVAPLLELGWIDGDPPGALSALAVAVYLLLHLLAVGPGIGLGLRKLDRRRLAIGLIAALVGSTALAGVVALGVRSSSGALLVTELIHVRPDGSATVHGNIMAGSGGGRSCTAHVRADIAPLGTSARVTLPLAVTRYPVGTQRTYRWNESRMVESLPLAARAWTLRGEGQLTFTLPTWRNQSASSILALDGVRTLEAHVHRAAGHLVVTVRNTTGAPIERALVLELTEGIGPWTPFTDLGALAPDQEKTVPVTRGPPRMGGFGEEVLWPTLLDVPTGWSTWGKALTLPNDERPLRLFVVSRVPGALAVDGQGDEVRHHALRADPVLVEGALTGE